METALPSSFTDQTGTQWELEIDVNMARRLKKELQIDLDKVTEGQVFMQLATSREKLGGLLWVLCEERALAEDLSPAQFFKQLGSSSLDSALIAVVGAIVNFTPQSSRPTVRLMWNQLTDSLEKGNETLEEWTLGNREMIQEKVESQVTQRAERAFGEL